MMHEIAVTYWPCFYIYEGLMELNLHSLPGALLLLRLRLAVGAMAVPSWAAVSVVRSRRLLGSDATDVVSLVATRIHIGTLLHVVGIRVLLLALGASSVRIIGVTVVL